MSRPRRYYSSDILCARGAVFTLAIMLASTLATGPGHGPGSVQPSVPADEHTHLCSYDHWEQTASPQSWYIIGNEDAGGHAVNMAGRNISTTPEALWRWMPVPTCVGFELAGPSSVCDAMIVLGLKRIVFVGDSLSYMQAQSLLFLLEPGRTKSPQENNWKPVDIICSGGGKLKLEYVRNDHLTSNPRGKYCSGWAPDFLSKTKPPSLYIFNTGAHEYRVNGTETANNPGGIKEFAKDFGEFAAVLEKHARQRDGDVVFWRPTPEGHANCTRFERPLERPPPVLPDAFGWNLFEDFNALARRALAAANLTRHAHVLDVVPMTRLRPDGHRGGFRREKFLNPALPDDCLHYFLPGPPDAWNHLLATHLSALARARRAPHGLL